MTKERFDELTADLTPDELEQYAARLEVLACMARDRKQLLEHIAGVTYRKASARCRRRNFEDRN